MGLFSKSVTDEEWLAQAKPLYDAALPYMTALNNAVVNESPEDGANAVNDALPKLPVIAQAIKKSPSPTSSEARRAKKDLESAMRCYTHGIKQGAKFFADLGIDIRIKFETQLQITVAHCNKINVHSASPHVMPWESFHTGQGRNGVRHRRLIATKHTVTHIARESR